jgi:hypothetical protein
MSISNLLSSIDSEISRLKQARTLLAGLAVSTAAKPVKTKHKISAAGLKAIAAAQRKRWAAVRKAAK